MTMPSASDRDRGDRSSGTDRRTFLKASAVATGAAAFAARPLPARGGRPAGRLSNKVTVVLFQRGGSDALSLYAPTGDPYYAGLRPTVAVPPPGSSAPGEGLPMDATFAMNPAMPGLHAAYTAPGSRVAVVHAVGYLPYDRSHFESQDLFEMGAAGPGVTSGWINRHLLATSTPQDAPVRGLALRGSLPRSMVGTYPCYAVASTTDLAFQGTQPDVRGFLELIVDHTPTAAMPPAKQLAYFSAMSSLDLIDHFAVLDPAHYVPANGAVYPTTTLGRVLREAAEVIKADLGVEFIAVDQGGWDHHSSLLSRIATYGADFDAAVTAFLTDLGTVADDVVLVSMSEFGREVRENGSAGTDHGAGGAMLVAGGTVQGGQVHGIWPGLAPAALQDGRYLAPRNDFRDVLLEILQDHMGGTNAAAVFPGHSYTQLGVI